MRFALLGFDDEALQLARAVADDNRHELVAAYEVAEGEQAVRQLAPFVDLDDDWESLLLGSVAEAVIVARSGNEDSRADKLRKLVQAKIPLLVVQPNCSAIVGYEIEMIREDVGSVVVPFVPRQNHPMIDWLATLTQPSDAKTDLPNESLGDIEQLIIERAMTDRTKVNVLTLLAQDAAIVRRLLGEVTRVSAIGGTKEKPSYSGLNVHLAVANETVIRWSVGPIDKTESAKLTVIGSRGKVNVAMLDPSAKWEIESSLAADCTENSRAGDEYTEAISRFVALSKDAVSSIDWLTTCHDIEITEAVQTSLRRGRTIDLYKQQPSEEQTFKGLMASWGCLLLMLGMAVMFGFALFDGVTMPYRDDAIHLNQPDEAASRGPLLLRLWPFYPFAAFLLLQLLQLVFRTPRPSSNQNESRDDDSTN